MSSSYCDVLTPIYLPYIPSLPSTHHNALCNVVLHKVFSDRFIQEIAIACQTLLALFGVKVMKGFKIHPAHAGFLVLIVWQSIHNLFMGSACFFFTCRPLDEVAAAFSLSFGRSESQVIVFGTSCWVAGGRLFHNEVGKQCANSSNPVSVSINYLCLLCRFSNIHYFLHTL